MKNLPALPRGFIWELWKSRLAPLWVDVKEILAFTGSLFLIQLFEYFPSVINTIFCGHLGKLELDSFAMATLILRTCAGFVAIGLSLACDTLVSQAYGSKNLREVGIILQRGILILMLFCFPCWAVFINTKSILLLFGQEPELTRQTDVLMLILIPVVPAIFMNQLLGKYLRNQNIISPQIVSGIAINIVNVILSASCVYLLNLGIVALMCTYVITTYGWLIVVVLYVLWKKLHADTWKGWSRECFQEWGVFVHFAFYSMLMVCFKWWTFEIGVFLSGWLGLVELGAQAVLYQIYILINMVHNGFAATANVLVGIALGARNAEQAKRSAFICLSCSGVFAVLISILVMALKDVLGPLYTNDKKIAALVSRLMPVFAILHLFDAVCFTSSGIVRGLGRQLFGAIITGMVYCIIGLPLEISLMFPAKLGILGLWLGILVSVIFLFICFLVIILRADWDKAMEEVQMRNELNPKGQTSNQDPSTQEKSSYTDLALEDIVQPERAARSPLPERVSLPKDLLLRRGSALAAAIMVVVAAILIRIFVNKD